MNIIDIANEFQLNSLAVKCEPYGCGHINDTYLVTAKNEKYIMQRINNNIFKNVDGLMQNIIYVTNFIKDKLKSENKSIDDSLSVIYTKDNKPYYKCDDGYFRMYNFISTGFSIETRATNEELKISACGFGKFQQILDGFDAGLLCDTIENFHNTVWRFENFLDAIDKDVKNRKKDVEREIEWYISRKKYANKIVDLLNSGEIPYRVTHNDTKLNNVLVDVKNKRPVCVIDLDTVMKGAICYDFGDSIRTGANTGAEDEKDLSKVEFDIDMYKAFSEGFVKELRGTLTEKEIETLHFGAILMTYECGMRFLTDYLSGDTYFKTKYAEHNLVRTRTQMKMVEGMEKLEKEMQDYILAEYNK